MFRIRLIILTILYHFSPLLAFYFANLFGGLEIGLKAALSVSLILAIVYQYFYKSLSHLFITFALYFCYFGIFSLMLNGPELSKFEEGIQLSYLSLYFLFSLFTHKNTIERLLTLNETIENFLGFTNKNFYKISTFTWAIYFAVCAAFNTVNTINLEHNKNQALTDVRLDLIFYFILFLTLLNSHFTKNLIKTLSVKQISKSSR